jgi:hypothetical protein
MRHAGSKDPPPVWQYVDISYSTIYFVVYNLALFYIFMRDFYKVYLTEKEKNKTYVKLNNLFFILLRWQDVLNTVTSLKINWN